MATFIKVKGLKEGDTVNTIQTMEVPDHLLHHYKNCDWYKSGKWVELKAETNTSIAAAEPIKREDYINVSNDFVSVSIESETTMKIKPKENAEKVEPMISNVQTARTPVTSIKIEDLPKVIQVEDMKIKKMKPEEKPPIKKKGRPKKS